MRPLISTIAAFYFRLGIRALIAPWILATDAKGIAALRPFGRFGAAYRIEGDAAVRFAVEVVVLIVGLFATGALPIVILFGWESFILWALISALAYRVIIVLLTAKLVKIVVLTGKPAMSKDSADIIISNIVRFVLFGWIGFGGIVLALSQTYPQPLWWVGIIIAVACGIRITVSVYILTHTTS